MSIIDKILGKPLASWEDRKQALNVATGVPALGLDALASTAYGPEAALAMLLPLGLIGLHYFFYITIAVVVLLVILYLSYQQTIAAYPNGGGAYIVASENIGKQAGLWAAIALLIDYLLNVAVGISAGIGAIISAFPVLHHHTLTLCLIVLLTLTILNLRGIRQTGITFLVPTVAFISCMFIAILIGLIHAWSSGGHPVPVVAPPPLPSAVVSITIWLLLGAFANGLTAMTGIEAISNAVPLFRKPVVKNAKLTLSVIVGILVFMLLAIGYLCPSYHIVAMDENKIGYQTILSQLVAATTGNGIFYYLSIISIFIVLTYSAQTSFAGFPRVCQLLAEDNFLPHFFADKGRRLVFSHGIIILAIFSAILLIIFKGITIALIPLFAVGAFSAFLFSQLGMVMHWFTQKNKDQTVYIKLFFNGLGAISTAIALIIIIASKFIEGAWIVIVIAPLLVLLLSKIRHHYNKIAKEIEEPLTLHTTKLQPPIVIIPILGWNCVSEKAVRFGMLLSNEITALYVSTDKTDDEKALKKLWAKKVEKPAKDHHLAIPHLKIVESPYRRIYKPILDFVKKMKDEHPDRIIAVILPELVEPHWYEYLLHNIHIAGLRALLFLERDQRTVVINTPWYLRDHPTRKSNRHDEKL